MTDKKYNPEFEEMMRKIEQGIIDDSEDSMERYEHLRDEVNKKKDKKNA